MKIDHEKLHRVQSLRDDLVAQAQDLHSRMREQRFNVTGLYSQLAHGHNGAAWDYLQRPFAEVSTSAPQALKDRDIDAEAFRQWIAATNRLTAMQRKAATITDQLKAAAAVASACERHAEVYL